MEACCVFVLLVNMCYNVYAVKDANLTMNGGEIFGFLGGLSGMTAAAVADLPMDVFFEMLIDVFKKKEFVGFMKVVSKLLK